MRSLLRDLRFGLRLLWVKPGLAASAVLERVVKGKVYGLGGTEPLLLPVLGS